MLTSNNQLVRNVRPYQIWHHQLKFAPLYHSISQSRSNISCTSHVEQLCGGDVRQQTQFTHLRALAARKTWVFVMCENVRRTTGPTMQTLATVKLVAQSMHRPERVHTPWYACYVNCEIIAIEFILAFDIEKSKFPKCSPISNMTLSNKVCPVVP